MTASSARLIRELAAFAHDLLDETDALACRPVGQVLEVEIPARRAGVFRVHVQVGVKAHAAIRNCGTVPL